MAIKMRVLTFTGKAKIKTIANEIKNHYDLAFNAVDVIPPAYSCDRERVVILAMTLAKKMPDNVRLFLRELSKERTANVALLVDGKEDAVADVKSILTEAGTNVIDEVLYMDGGMPIFGSKPKAEELQVTFDWVGRVIENLK